MTAANVNSSVVGDIIKWGANTPSGRLTVALIVSTVALAIFAASVLGGMFGLGLCVAGFATTEAGVGLAFGGVLTFLASFGGVILSGFLFDKALGHFDETLNMALNGK
ncbi:MAG: hypothetical protein ACK4HV_06510 [Parachlamydiaceae bacterium]